MNLHAECQPKRMLNLLVHGDYEDAVTLWQDSALILYRGIECANNTARIGTNQVMHDATRDTEMAAPKPIARSL